MKIGYLQKLIKEKKLLRKLFWLARVLVLLFILIVVCCFIYINEIGFPRYLQNLLIKNLESKGYRISIGKTKFGWYRGIIIENLKIESNLGDSTSIFESKSADILPSFFSIFKNKPEIKRIRTYDGNLKIPINKDGNSNDFLNIEELNSFFRFYSDGSVNFELLGKIRKFKINIYAQRIDLQTLYDSITNTYSRGRTERNSESSYDRLNWYLNKINQIDAYVDSKVDIKINSAQDNSNVILADISFDLPLVIGKTFSAHNLNGKILSIPLSGSLKGHKAQGQLRINSFRSKNMGLEHFIGDFFVLYNENELKNIKLSFKNKYFKTMDFEIRDVFNIIQFSTTNFPNSRLISPVEVHGNAGGISFNGFQIHKATYDGFITNNIFETNVLGLDIKTAIGQAEKKEFNIENLFLNYSGTLNTKQGYRIKGHIDIQSDLIKSTNFFVKLPKYSGIIDYSSTNVFISSLQGDLNFLEFRGFDIDVNRGSIKTSYESPILSKNSNNLNIFNIIFSSIFSISADLDNIKYKDSNINNIKLNIESDLNNLKINELRGNIGSGKINLSSFYNKTNNLLKTTLISYANLDELQSIIKFKISNFTNFLEIKTPFYLKVDSTGIVPDIKLLVSNNASNAVKNLKHMVGIKLPTVNIGKEKIKNVESDFSYMSNQIFIDKLSFILKTNPITANGNINLNNYDSLIKFYGFINPSDVFDLISITNQQVLMLISNSFPFELTAEARANLRNVKDINSIFNDTNINLRGRISATNFTFRNKFISELRCDVNYYSNVLAFSNVELFRPNEKAYADKIIADFNIERVYLINAKGNLSPSDLTEAIGEEAHYALSPFKFAKVPTVTANGSVPMHGAIGDIEFNIFAPELEWWKIKVKNASSKVLWKNETVTLKNFYSDFYNGSLNLSLYADFTEAGLTNLNYNAKISKANINELLKDLLNKPQKIEGDLSGQLEISSRLITNYYQWYGKGEATLEDGLIWDIPIFGIFSPILNTVSPGLGNSRANYASAHFVITNGLVATSDLEIRAKAVRMKYEGTVDFDKRIDARVEAEVLRDVWLVGPAIRFLLKPLTKLFIYKVEGTIDKPVSEPLFIPKILLAPLHPFKTIKDYIFPSNESKNGDKDKK